MQVFQDRFVLPIFSCLAAFLFYHHAGISPSAETISKALGWVSVAGFAMVFFIGFFHEGKWNDKKEPSKTLDVFVITLATILGTAVLAGFFSVTRLLPTLNASIIFLFTIALLVLCCVWVLQARRTRRLVGGPWFFRKFLLLPLGLMTILQVFLNYPDYTATALTFFLLSMLFLPVYQEDVLPKKTARRA